MSPSGMKTMAKKKGKPAQPQPEPAGRKPMVVQIRGSEAYKAWVEGLAEKEGFSVAMFFERAARKWAKEIGYPDPPKR